MAMLRAVRKARQDQERWIRVVPVFRSRVIYYVSRSTCHVVDDTPPSTRCQPPLVPSSRWTIALRYRSEPLGHQDGGTSTRLMKSRGGGQDRKTSEHHLQPKVFCRSFLTLIPLRTWRKVGDGGTTRMDVGANPAWLKRQRQCGAQFVPHRRDALAVE